MQIDRDDPKFTTLTPVQRRWIGDDRPLKIYEKSRRVGATWAASARRTRIAMLRPNHDCWWMTRDLVTARDFLRYCAEWATYFGLAGQFGEEVVVVDKKGQRALALVIRGGGRIVAISSNPNAAAGKGGDIGLDEFALHADQELLLQVSRPVAMWGGQVEIISTHRSSRTLFNQLIRRLARPQGADGQDWSWFRDDIHEALAIGLMGPLNATTAERGRPPRSADGFVAAERSGCPAAYMWHQEYLCDPQESGNSLLSMTLVGDCEASWEALQQVGRDAAAVGARRQCFAGMDIGRERDLTVIWVVETVGDVAYTRAVKVLSQVPFQMQLEALLRLLETHRVQRCAIDATGIGMMLAEQATAHYRGGQVEGVTFTVGLKSDLANRLLRAFEDRRVRVPADAAVRDDLCRVRRVATAAGHIRYDADADGQGHADRFWALALALYAADHRAARLDMQALPKRPDTYGTAAWG